MQIQLQKGLLQKSLASLAVLLKSKQVQMLEGKKKKKSFHHLRRKTLGMCKSVYLDFVKVYFVYITVFNNLVPIHTKIK